ncbi:MAG: hypothetical protein M3376_04265 [Actinomycetota bacterium]|nr:hypothetical protein [Actinomycetota bacterium]
MRSQTEELAAELKQVIRLATRDPEALEGTLPVLSSFHKVLVLGEIGETARVHFILHRLIAEYAKRLPPGRDGRAIRELLTWEDADGDARSLTTRYHHAAAHLVNAPGDFGRRQEPRLLLECARRFIAFDHDDRLDVGSAPAATPAPPPALAHEPGLSPLAPLLWTRAEQDHQRRLAAIRGGIFSVSNQDEVLDLLLTLTRAAEHTLHAVDQTGLERWFGNARLQYYLEAQLQRAHADKICVERLRFVRRGQLDDPRERTLLREFIRLHDEAGATLLLCPAEAAHELRTSFDSRMFMALIDIDQTPACLTGWLGEEGYIERSLLYLRELDPVRTHYGDLLRLKEHINHCHYDQTIRDILASHHDEPDPHASAHPALKPSTSDAGGA